MIVTARHTWSAEWILPPDATCQYCAWISNRRVIGDEVPFQTSNMKQHLHQTTRHKTMILLKSCTVLIGHVSCRIFTELLAHGRGRTISYRCFFCDAVPIDTAASQLMVSFPMIPELMDNSWLRGNGRWRVNHSVERDVIRTDPHIVLTSQIWFRKIPESDVSVREGVLSIHRLNALSMIPRPCLQMTSLIRSTPALWSCHSKPCPQFSTTSDGKASRWGEFLELILCHLILQVGHLEVDVSLCGQQRENEGSFHEQSQGAMPSVRIVQIE